jgi:hypothetical protein
MIGSNAVITVAFFVATASVAWSAAYAWGKWLAHRHDAPALPRAEGPGEAARLARLEAGLEALTLEVERLAEGQRFSARLLDERLPRPLPAATRPAEPGRVITPH